MPAKGQKHDFYYGFDLMQIINLKLQIKERVFILVLQI